MNVAQVRTFRKILRRFERLQAAQLKDTCCCCGVTLAQCHALLEIEEQGNSHISLLTKSLGLEKSTVSRTVDGLVNIGLVKRVPRASDRRFIALTLTKKGKEICKKINGQNDAYFKDVFRTIPRDLHEEVIDRFHLLVQAIARRDAPGKSGDGSYCKETE
jgi:DNA-binding MarR family transcriptional regulator